MNKYKKRVYKKKHALGYKQKKEVSKICKSVINRKAETKYIVDAFTMQGGQAGLFQDLGLPTQGTGESSRIGADISMVGLHVKGAVSAKPGIVDNIVRFLGFLDKENSLSSTNQIFNSLGVATAPFSSYTPDFRHLWTKLFDKTFVVAASTSASCKLFDIYIPLKGAINTMDTLLVALRNSVNFIVVGDEPTLGNNATIDFQVTLTYKDM